MAGAVLVRLADEGARVVLVLFALERAGSAALGGLLVASLLIPHVVAAPLVGLVTGRASRPALATAGGALLFALSLVATAAFVGALPTGVIVAVLVIGGSCGPALTGGLSSQLPELVDAAVLPRAFGLDSFTYNISGIAGPAVAALVASLAGAVPATLTLAGSLGLGGMLLLTLNIRNHPTADRTDSRFTAGIKAVVRDRVLAIVTSASSLGQLGPGAAPVVAGVAAAAVGRPSTSGWLVTAVAIGGLFGSLLWTVRPAPVRRSPLVVMLAMIGMGIPLGLAALSHSLLVTGVLFGLSGAMLGPFVGALFTIRHDRAPKDARAQVFTTGAGLKTTTAALGAALAGLLAHIPLPQQFLILGASPVTAGVLGIVALRLTERRH